jgi:hypothetical protein
MDALLAVLSESHGHLKDIADKKAEAACFDPSFRPMALEFIGRAREVGYLFDLLMDLRRSQS